MMQDDFILTHKQIRERQAACTKMLSSGSMSVMEYADTMNQLNDELRVAEEKMYAVADCAIKSQGMQMFLDRTPILRFITNTVPPAFKKIHARFPHLTLDEVAEFERTVRAAGGSIMTHSGIFGPMYRSWHYDQHCILARKSVIISWGCCNGRGYDGKSSYPDRCMSYTETNQYGAYDCKSNIQCKYWAGEVYPNAHLATSPDLMNRSPVGKCNNPSQFSLSDGTDVLPNDQKNSDAVANAIATTRAQIEKFESAISDLRQGTDHLSGLLKTLMTLSDSPRRGALTLLG